MLSITFTTQFKKDIKLMEKRGKNLDKLFAVIQLLQNETPLPSNYKDHMLVGNFKGFHECHIEPDWLLIYKIYQNELILSLTRTGSHSDLLRK